MSMLAVDGLRYTWPDFDSARDELSDGSLLYLSDARGRYIPRDFAICTRRDCVCGVDDKTWAALEDPDGEWYWDAWADVLDNATVRDPETGRVYGIYQDGDCWLVPLEPV